MPTHPNYNPNLAGAARELRNNPTKQEQKLWYQYLSPCDFRWRRQRPIGQYIVDFYCDRAKLVVELDGSQHYEPEEQAYDEQRTKHLNNLGLEVMRFSNVDVDRNFTAVCEAIDNRTRERIQMLEHPKG